ncbi:hypothetical protein CHLRE_06g306014v5 [Chlamydomonas reinhardtii]|uniref:Uncharacterized protein n=1 Tax=Chlamydomonas reinhardtii TaxID=3055 RepID=A0A2K3DRB0_CHLRE|nr:uncharacterized protein CHLRE_06g306014v5 [Chlamydomonas reinhardtii]PNW83081.1 hypothetical protein CHLRE_06g306014v5 [Chlamydomonas reinhardtii]
MARLLGLPSPHCSDGGDGNSGDGSGSSGGSGDSSDGVGGGRNGGGGARRAGGGRARGQTGRRLWLQARLKEQPALKRCQWGQRRWRLTVHVRTQKVLEHTAQQLAGGRPKEEVIVGWGNANTGYGGCISRLGRGPNRALLRLLVDKYAHLVVYVDEFYTSQAR